MNDGGRIRSEDPGGATRQIPDGSWVTTDGGWLWRGGRWVALAPAASPPSLNWFVGTPSWIPTLLVIGLIGLIPIAGVMNAYGYALVTARNLRAGYRVLPPANLSFVRAGAPAAVLGLAWALATVLLFLLVAAGTGAVTYASTHDWLWTVALGLAGGITVATLLGAIYRVLLVPSLELSGRVGWAVFRSDLIGHARENWRATWYGNAVLLVWTAAYSVVALVAAIVPLGGILVAVVATPVMAALLALTVARFDDPPAGFTRGWADAVAWSVLGLTLLAIGLTWAVGLSSAAYAASHPEVVACILSPGPQC